MRNGHMYVKTSISADEMAPRGVWLDSCARVVAAPLAGAEIDNAGFETSMGICFGDLFELLDGNEFSGCQRSSMRVDIASERWLGVPTATSASAVRVAAILDRLARNR